jgi:hypothetical protein
MQQEAIMKRFSSAMALWLVLGLYGQAALAEEPQLQIQRNPYGSGQPNATGLENAQPVADFSVWHAPQYMPGYPTAATIWPRVVMVHCTAGVCDGYFIAPNMGPGEYLFFKPDEK